MKLAKKDTSSFEERKMLVGLDVFKVVAVNPTVQELNKIYDNEDSESDEEINYVDEKDGVDRVRINVYVRGIRSNKLGKISFFIADKDSVSQKGNHQYINQVCETSWSSDESSLPAWFTNFYTKDDKVNSIGTKQYRIGREGEGRFYEFARKVLSKVNYFIPDTEIKFDFDKMRRGNFSDLKYLMDDEWSSTFTSMWYVKNVEGEDGVKSYNEIFYPAIAEANFCSKVETATSAYYKSKLEEIKSDEALFKSLKIPGVLEIITVHDIYGYVDQPNITFKSTWDNRVLKQFLDKTEGEHGCRGFYKIAPIFEYSSEMDITSTNNVSNHATDDSTY